MFSGDFRLLEIPIEYFLQGLSIHKGIILEIKTYIFSTKNNRSVAASSPKLSEPDQRQNEHLCQSKLRLRDNCTFVKCLISHPNIDLAIQNPVLISSQHPIVFLHNI